MGLPSLADEYGIAIRAYQQLPRHAYGLLWGGLPVLGGDSLLGSAAATGAHMEAEAGSGSPAGQRGKAGAPGRNKSRQRRRPDESREVQVGKAMCEVLRHQATALSLDIRSDGYVVLEDLLACRLLEKFKCERAEIDAIVAGCSKKRFTLAEIDGTWRIRANQGHSMKEVQDDLLLERLEPGMEGLPSYVVHGTYLKHWGSILEAGLLAGGMQGRRWRNHVHFAAGLPQEGGVISGMRMSCEVAVYLDVHRALAEELPMYKSANDVLLTPGFDGVVPVELFQKAVRLKDGVQLWPPSQD